MICGTSDSKPKGVTCVYIHFISFFSAPWNVVVTAEAGGATLHPEMETC